MSDQDPRPALSAEEKAQLLLNRLKEGFDSTPFVKLVGIRLNEATMESVKASFDMKPELIGNTFKRILHGGVIATALDMVGGFMCLVGAYQRMKQDNISRDERNMRMTKIGTIDMRVDYLRPGAGERFEATATLLRTGKKVVVTRMDLHNEKGDLIATATGTYFY